MTERNKEIDILKGEASKQINQIRESITKFLDKETGTLGEGIRTLFKEQGIMIVSILTAISMAIGVLIEALLGGPNVPATTTSGGTSGGDKKSGAREWIKKQIESSIVYQDFNTCYKSPYILRQPTNHFLCSIQDS